MPDHTRARDGGQPRQARSKRSPLQQFLQRLTELGATADERAEVALNWDTFDDDWTPERRAEVVALGDHELAAMLTNMRAEYVIETTTDVPEPTDAAGAQLLADATQVIGSKVDDVLGWVYAADDWDGTHARAQVIVALEREADTPRTTLLAPLDELLAAGEDPAD